MKATKPRYSLCLTGDSTLHIRVISKEPFAVTRKTLADFFETYQQHIKHKASGKNYHDVVILVFDEKVRNKIIQEKEV